MFQILADEAIPFIDRYFSAVAKVHPVPASNITHQNCLGYDGLLVRSVTRVNEQLLQDSSVRWVGTATIGTEHLDVDWMEQNNIKWHSAPGCNALAVVQYVLSALAAWCRKSKQSMSNLKFGIIGLGQVGHRLSRALDLLSIEYLYCDPFVNVGPGPVGLTRLFNECNVISLHVPYTSSGAAPTHHLIDEAVLDSYSTGNLLINAARGSVIDAAALERWMNSGGDAILDVWPNEPNISQKLLDKVFLGTAHIAGYSMEGKHNATLYLYRSLCQLLNIKQAPEIRSPLPAKEELPTNNQAEVIDLLLDSYDIYRDAARLAAEAEVSMVNHFANLRNGYKFRRDYSGQYSPKTKWTALMQQLAAL